MEPEPFHPDLSGVPETMLWTLYDRAQETLRRDGVLRDPRSVSICETIDYDFAGRFGAPSRFASVRAAETDRVIRRWLAKHPDGQVVSLGEGLETQATRVDNGKMRWLTVDLPDAIRVRERFIRPTDRFHHLSMSATDLRWMRHVELHAGVFVVAQGLLMYLEPDMVRSIFEAIGSLFQGAEVLFDTVPKWYSEPGANHKLTGFYVVPAMPWVIDRNEIKPLLRSWCPSINSIRFLRFRAPKARPAFVDDLCDMILPRRRQRNCLVHVTFSKPWSRTAPAALLGRAAGKLMGIFWGHGK